MGNSSRDKSYSKEMCKNKVQIQQSSLDDGIYDWTHDEIHAWIRDGVQRNDGDRKNDVWNYALSLL